MEIDLSDLEKIRRNLDQMTDTVEWKRDTDLLAEFLYPILRNCTRILDSYLDPDEVKTSSELIHENLRQGNLFADDDTEEEDRD